MALLLVDSLNDLINEHELVGKDLWGALLVVDELLQLGDLIIAGVVIIVKATYGLVVGQPVLEGLRKESRGYVVIHVFHGIVIHAAALIMEVGDHIWGIV